MKCIAYISLETRRLGKADIHDILRVSRDRNAARGVTGVLLYYGGLFLQVLEGEDTRLADLMETLRRDRRHGDLRIILDEPTDERHFPDWSMAFVDLADLPAEDGWLCRNLDRPLAELRSTQLAERIRRLIGSFQAMVRSDSMSNPA